MKAATNYRVLIPNAFTAFSLILGLIALYKTSQGEFVEAAWIIAASMACDFLDGKLARLLHASSKFGAWFDSVADFIAFGVVPGFLAFKASFQQIHFFGWFIAAFYVIAGGFRLIRFTLSLADTTTKKPFIGLPIPAAAGTISSFCLINFYVWNEIKSPDLFLTIVFLVSILMVSKIEYLPLEKGKKITPESKFFIGLLVLSFLAALRYPYFIFIAWITIYILYGVCRHLILIGKKNNRLGR